MKKVSVALGSFSKELDERLADWILYRLRGGRQELLALILEPGRYPVSERYALLKHALQFNREPLRASIGKENATLLEEEPTGYVFDLVEENSGNAEKRLRVLPLAAAARMELARHNEALISSPEIFRDQNGVKVDVDLRLDKYQFQQLVGDLLSQIAVDLYGQLRGSGVLPDELAMIEIMDSAPEMPHVRAEIQGAFGSPAESEWLRPLLPFDLTELTPNQLLRFIDTEGEHYDILGQFSYRAFIADLCARLDYATDLSRVRDARIDEKKVVRLLLREFGLPEKLGSYRILRILGRSTVGIACVAKDEDAVLDREYVLKVLKNANSLPTNPWENDVLCYVSDTNNSGILHIRDIKQNANLIFLVMEYMDGGNVEDALSELEPARGAQHLIYILQEVCRSLARAHSRGIVHGAIKPQNILVSADLRRVRLGDFRILLLPNHGEVSVSSFDVPDGGASSNPLCNDIYSLGATMHHLLTKMHLRNESGKGICIENGRPSNDPESGELRTVAPVWFDRIIRHCLVQRPDDRFQDAMELLSHVAPFVDPTKASRITLSASYESNHGRVNYQLLDSRGRPVAQRLGSHLSQPCRETLFHLWERLGLLALTRLRQIAGSSDGQPCDKLIQDELSKLGDAGNDVFGPVVYQRLTVNRDSLLDGESGEHLLLRHDAELEAIPWELLALDGRHLCRRFPMARLPELSRHSEVPMRCPIGNKVHVLLIADPTGHLEWARRECEQLLEVLEKSALALDDRLEVRLLGTESDPLDLRQAIRSCDVLHFAGHGVHFPGDADLRRNGWLMKGHIDSPEHMDVLQSTEMENFWRSGPPVLVFANGCATGRVSLEATAVLHHSDATRGLAPAFLAAGAASYIGTLWDPPDNGVTVEFAKTFYREFLSGCSVAQAMLTARNVCAKDHGEEDLTWARYLLFGDPTAHIEVR